MAKYKKKPTEIEAFQMTLERRWDNSEWPPWLLRAWNSMLGKNALWIDPNAPIADGREAAAELVCGTREGNVQITWGDWIIRDIQGELCLCKSEIFEATYELVEPLRPTRTDDGYLMAR